MGSTSRDSMVLQVSMTESVTRFWMSKFSMALMDL
jgi:hypothetical protein